MKTIFSHKKKSVPFLDINIYLPEEWLTQCPLKSYASVVVVQQFSGQPSALPAVKDTAVGVSSERGRTTRSTAEITSAGLSTETVRPRSFGALEIADNKY